MASEIFTNNILVVIEEKVIRCKDKAIRIMRKISLTEFQLL